MPGPIIRSVRLDAPSFVNSFKRLPENIKEQAKLNIKKLLNNPVPAKLHYHKMTGVEFYCIHITSCSTYKASLTVQGDIAVFRKAGPHDRIDKNP